MRKVDYEMGYGNLVAGRQDQGDPGEAGAERAEAGAILQTAGHRGGTQAAHGRPDPGEGRGMRAQSYSLLS